MFSTSVVFSKCTLQVSSLLYSVCNAVFTSQIFSSTFQNNRLETLSAKPDALDWSFYKQHISKPGFVEMFEKSVSLKYRTVVCGFEDFSFSVGTFTSLIRVLSVCYGESSIPRRYKFGKNQ